MTIPFPPIPPNSTRVILHASPVNLRVSRQLLRGELIGPILTRHAAARMSARLGGERERTGRAGLFVPQKSGFRPTKKLVKGVDVYSLPQNSSWRARHVP